MSKRFYKRVEMSLSVIDKAGDTIRIGTQVMEVSIDCKKLDQIFPGDDSSAILTERFADFHKDIEDDQDSRNEESLFGFIVKVIK